MKNPVILQQFLRRHSSLDSLVLTGSVFLITLSLQVVDLCVDEDKEASFSAFFEGFAENQQVHSTPVECTEIQRNRHPRAPA